MEGPMRAVSFDEFDAYAEAIENAADLRATMTRRPDQPRWSVRDVVLPSGVHLQTGSEAGGSIVEGATRRDGTVVWMRRAPTECRTNGVLVKPGSALLIPPGGEFCLAETGASQWLSVFVPEEIAASLGGVARRRPRALRCKRRWSPPAPARPGRGEGDLVARRAISRRCFCGRSHRAERGLAARVRGVAPGEPLQPARRARWAIHAWKGPSPRSRFRADHSRCGTHRRHAGRDDHARGHGRGERRLGANAANRLPPVLRRLPAPIPADAPAASGSEAAARSSAR